MPVNRRAGIMFFKVDGALLDAKGNFTYHIGSPKREAVNSNDRTVGYKETPQAPYIEGEIIDDKTVSLKQLQNLTEATVQVDLANGKSVVVRDAWYAHDGAGGTEEGMIPIRFEGLTGEEFSG